MPAPWRWTESLRDNPIDNGALMSTAGARILVVDDDSGGRRLTRAILAKAGFRVTEASDGKAALEAMQASLPDLVLMDVSMPVMDGFAACAGLRRLPGGDRIPVIMMTGLDDTESIERAFEVGATDFVTKPINWTVLPHRVRYMLRASSAINDLQQNERRLSNAQRIGSMGDWEWNLRDGKVSASAKAWRIFGHERPLFAFQAAHRRVRVDRHHQLPAEFLGPAQVANVPHV